MSNKKDQHYVPRFLLKNFSSLSLVKKRLYQINVFHKSTQQIKCKKSIKNVFMERYFYDNDNSVENFLNDAIETPASRVINELINEKFEILNDEEKRLIIIRFIYSLLYRTPEALDKASEFINANLEPVIRELLRLKELDPEEASKGTFSFNSRELISDITCNAIINSIFLKDLKFHVIKNKTDLEFCISDHPVFSYNYLYRDLEHPAVTSITARGLQIFCPLSPSLTICLYDPKVYKYGDKNSLVTHVSKNADIEVLNSFQIINSSSEIGFRSETLETHIKQLHEKFKDIKIHEYESKILDKKSIEENIKSKFITFVKQTKLNKMPRVIKIKKNAKRLANTFYERDPNLSRQLMRFYQKLSET